MKKKPVIPFALLPDLGTVSEENLIGVELGAEEFKRIRRLLGRAPNKIEFSIIEALWSERCCEKSTKAYLSGLLQNTSLPQVDMAEGFALVQKIGSDNNNLRWALTLNHMLGDLVAKGAEPLAVVLGFNSLGQSIEKQHSLMGLAAYCAGLQIPSFVNSAVTTCDDNVREVATFLVNGLLNKKVSCEQKALGAKNRIMYVGQATDDFSMEAAKHKQLFEASLKAIEKGYVIGSCSIGIAGLARAITALASHGASGILLHLDDIPRSRSTSLEQCLLSESPGRMLFVSEPKMALLLKEHFARYNVNCVDIGSVHDDGLVRVIHYGQEIVHVAATLILENAPRLRLNYQSTIPHALSQGLKRQINISLKNTLAALQPLYIQGSSPFFAQFDPYVGLNTKIAAKESHAAVLSLWEGDITLAMTLSPENEIFDGNPYESVKRVLFHALLSLSIQGTKPLGLCCSLLAFSPENGEVMTNLKHAIDAMADIASRINVTIISAAASIVQCTTAKTMLMVGAVGSSNVRAHTRFASALTGDTLVLLGDMPTDYTGAESIFKGTENLHLRCWELESLDRLMSVTRQCVRKGITKCAGVVGRGGLYKSLVDIMTKSNLGINLDFGSEWLEHELVLSLISEETPRILMTVPEQHIAALMKECAQKVVVYTLGSVGGCSLSVRHQGKVVY